MRVVRISPACLALAAALSLALSSCGKEQPEPPTGDAASGRAIVERNCQSCHAIGPEGASPVADAPPFRELVKRWPPENLAEALGEGIDVAHNGKVQMPEFELEPEQIDDLIAYLETLQPDK
jgi:cytochrome c